VGVAETRGLTFLEPLAPQLITRPELTEYLAAIIDAEDQDELARFQELYWLLGLLDPSVELYGLFLDLLGEQVLGLFNLETDELLVVAETLPLDTAGKLTMAHELVHALQQQRFDARRLVEESETNQDRELAMTALLEGDATVASGLYAAANLSMAGNVGAAAKGGRFGGTSVSKSPACDSENPAFPPTKRAPSSCLRFSRRPASGVR